MRQIQKTYAIGKVGEELPPQPVKLTGFLEPEYSF